MNKILLAVVLISLVSFYSCKNNSHHSVTSSKNSSASADDCKTPHTVTVMKEPLYNNDSLYALINDEKHIPEAARLNTITSAAYKIIEESLLKIDSLSGGNESDLHASGIVMIDQHRAEQLKSSLEEFNHFAEQKFTREELKILEINSPPFAFNNISSQNLDWEHVNFDFIPAIAAETLLIKVYLHNLNSIENIILSHWILMERN